MALFWLIDRFDTLQGVPPAGNFSQAWLLDLADTTIAQQVANGADWKVADGSTWAAANRPRWLAVQQPGASRRLWSRPARVYSGSADEALPQAPGGRGRLCRVQPSSRLGGRRVGF